MTQTHSHDKSSERRWNQHAHLFVTRRDYEGQNAKTIPSLFYTLLMLSELSLKGKRLKTQCDKTFLLMTAPPKKCSNDECAKQDICESKSKHFLNK